MTPTTPLRRFALGCLALLSLPTLMPLALAGPNLPGPIVYVSPPQVVIPADIRSLVEQASDPCKPDHSSYHYNFTGYVAITGKGKFLAWADEWTDGCGGEQCDDSIYGSFLGGSPVKEYHFYVVEQYGANDNCVLECMYEDHVGSHYFDGDGHVTTKVVKDSLGSDQSGDVVFDCTANYSWVMGGHVKWRRATGGSDVEDLVPGVELPDLGSA